MSTIELFAGLARRRGWDAWATPRDLFERLNREFGFTLDVAASAENALCGQFFTEADDGLAQPWTGRVWCNPPYGRAIGEWVERAARYAFTIPGPEVPEVIVMLIPASTDTSWWHDHVHGQATEVRLIRGRLTFGRSRMGRAPFPSAIAVYRPRVRLGGTYYTTIGRDA